jgi:hypothetical protein
MLRLFYPFVYTIPLLFSIFTLIFHFDEAVGWCEFEKSCTALTAYCTTVINLGPDSGNVLVRKYPYFW